MSSVTFPTAIGGDGSTVSDDDNATTGLRNGGWRTRFIPCFTNLVNIANYMVSYTAQTSTFATPPPMGSTTPNTGAFTRVTVTGSTAPVNGLYLPATNALGFATNSTERVRIDSSGNVGIGTSSPGVKLDVSGAARGTDVIGSTRLRVVSGVTSVHWLSSINDLIGSGSTTDAAFGAYGSFNWYPNNGTTLAMKLDSSGNLGIGTSSPGTKLDIGSGTLRIKNATGDTGGLLIYQAASDTSTIFNYYSGPLVFGTGNAEKMRLDSSGNLGLGVTPSGWSGGNAGFQTPYGWIVGNNQVNLLCNTYYNAGTKYVQNGYASGIQMSTSGGIVFSLAGNNTSGAGANSVFTAAMTLDSSGNLLVGKTATDNSERLGVKSSGSTNSTYAVRVDNSAATAMFMVRDDGYVRSPTTYNLTGGTANVVIDANGFFTRATSSLRYKKDVVDYDKGLEIVNLLRPVYYKSSVAGADGTIPDTQFAGMIAEEIDVLGLSEFVEYGPDGEVESIRYGNMVSLAFKAIQELSAELNELKKRIN